MAKYDDLNTKQIFIIGIGSVVVTVVTILAVQYVYYLLVAGHQSAWQAESNYNRQNEILADQFADVSEYGADPLTGKPTIPVERAMEWVVKDSEKSAADEPEEDKKTEKEST